MIAPSPTTRSLAPAVALLLLVQCAFASLSVVGKVTVAVVPWPAMMLARTLGALAVFCAWGVLRGEPMLPPRALWGRALTLGALGVFVNQACFLAGLRRTSAIHATVLIATIPLFTAIFAVLTGRERFRPRLAQGIALSTLGLVAVVRPDAAALASGSLVGDALVVVNCAAYGMYLALARDLVVAHGGAAVVRWAFFGGAMLALPVGLPSLVHTLTVIPPRAAGALGYVVLVPTAFAYAANAWCLGRMPASMVSVFIYLQPLLAAALALTAGPALARWLSVPAPRESLGPWLVAGAAMVLLGVFRARPEK